MLRAPIRDHRWFGGASNLYPMIAAPLAPIVVAVLATIGLDRGYYGRGVRVTMVTAVTTLLLLVVGYLAARAVRRERGAANDLAQALDLSPCMVRSLDGVIEYWPQGCQALYGWTAVEAVGARAQDLLKIQFPEPFEQIQAALLRDGQWTGELLKETRAGEVRTIAARWVLDDRGPHLPPRIVESATDVTALRLTADALRSAQDRLSLAVATFGLGVIDYDPRAKTLTISREMETIAGVQAGALDGDAMAWQGMFVPDDLGRTVDTVKADMAAKAEKRAHSIRIRRPDGALRTLRGVRRYLYDTTGDCHRIISIYMDDTEQQLGQDRLKESEERLASAVGFFELGIIDLSNADKTYVFSPEIEQILGLPRGGLGTTAAIWRSMVLPDDMQRLLEESDRQLLAGVPRAQLDLRVRRADGEVRELRGGVVYTIGIDGERTRSVGIFQDVTDQLRDRAEVVARGERLIALQSELNHASRLSAMGEMAAALAHELNQPLTAVGATVGAIGMLMGGDKAIDGPVRKRISEAAAQAEAQTVRAGEIVRRLREFIARGEADSRAENLDALITDAVALAMPNPLASNVEVREEFSPKVREVLADRIQIQQVMVNLIRNALEAMREQTAPRILTISTAVKGPMAEVCVHDNGPGVSSDVAERLFSPFVSTKSSGMGVGLSICLRIVEAHGGKMWAAPAPGGGGAFHFTLPLIRIEARHGR
jgi:two-component system sensor kinase FixL